MTSPVYGFDVSGQMKAPLDHLCYLWISHRPDARMFRKVGPAASTTAGIGVSHATKTMRGSLTYRGAKKVLSPKAPVSAMKWDDVSEKRRAKIAKKARKLARGIARAANRGRNPLFRSFPFKMMAVMQRKSDWNPADRNHWESQGWLAGKTPF